MTPALRWAACVCVCVCACVCGVAAAAAALTVFVFLLFLFVCFIAFLVLFCRHSVSLKYVYAF